MGLDYVASVGYGVCIKVKGAEAHSKLYDALFSQIISWWKESGTDVEDYAIYSEYRDSCPIQLESGGDMIAAEDDEDMYILICLKESITKLWGFGGCPIVRTPVIEDKHELLATIIAIVREVMNELGRTEEAILDWHLVMEVT